MFVAALVWFDERSHYCFCWFVTKLTSSFRGRAAEPGIQKRVMEILYRFLNV
jgi:hypothetical protein